MRREQAEGGGQEAEGSLVFSKHRRSVFSIWKGWAESPQGMALLLLGRMALKTAIAPAFAFVVAQTLYWEHS